MANKITYEEIEFILESLTYTKKSFQEYEYFPSEEFRKERLLKVDELVKKLKKINQET